MLYIPRQRKIAQPRFGMTGRLRSVLIDGLTGRVSRTLNHNVIVQDALADIPLSIFQARSAYVTQMGVGTGLVDPADTDSALTTEVLKKAITEPIDTSNLTGATPYAIVTVQFLPGQATGNLTEAGLFLSTNDMWNHAMFGRGQVSAATQANPVVITSADHGIIDNGTRVRFDGIDGMTALNFSGSNYYYVSVLSSSTFSLYTDVGLTSPLDGSGFSAFSAGANTWTIVIDKPAANTLFASFEIQAQNAP